MRITLYIFALLSTTQLFAQAFSDSTLMNRGTQQPRSEIIVYDRENTSENQNVTSSRFVSHIDDWEHPSDDKSIFESKFSQPFLWLGRETFLRVGSTSAPYTLMVNGVEVGRVTNSSSPAEFNITKVAKEGRNTVTLSLDSDSTIYSEVEGWRTQTTPAVGEVYVLSQPTQMIRDIAVETTLIGESLQAEFKLAIKSYALNPRTSTIYYYLYDENGKLVTFANQNITLSMRDERSISFLAKIPKSEGWSAENPKLYTLSLKTKYQGRFVELHSYKVGIRSVEVDPQSGAIQINGTPTTLTTREVGAEFKPSDIDALKNEGCNTIRLRAGAASREIFDAADQKGLYIIATMPINSSAANQNITQGGNPSNDPRWWGAYMQRIESGYHTAKLHPSVIAFSLADSSLNGYNLYEGYLRLKSKGDSRPMIYFENGDEWNSDKLLINLRIK